MHPNTSSSCSVQVQISLSPHDRFDINNERRLWWNNKPNLPVSEIGMNIQFSLFSSFHSLNTFCKTRDSICKTNRFRCTFFVSVSYIAPVKKCDFVME